MSRDSTKYIRTTNVMYLILSETIVKECHTEQNFATAFVVGVTVTELINVLESSILTNQHDLFIIDIS